MSDTSRSRRWPQRLLLIAAVMSAVASLVVGIWLPAATLTPLLPLSESDFEREMSLGNVYGYGLTVPVTAHGPPEAQYLRITLGDSAGYTGFGIAHAASVAAGGHMVLRWRSKGQAAYVAVEVQSTPADLPGRATWFVSIDAPGAEWSVTKIPLTEFEWNANSNPPDWPVRPFDPSTLYGFSMTLPPGADIEIDIATVEIRTSNNKEPILALLLLLTCGLAGAWYVTVQISHRRHAERNLVASEHERQRLEEQLVQSQKMEAVGRLAGGIAHDFNNLLTGLMVACDLAHRDLENREQLATWLDQIRDLTRKASGVTGQLLAFSRGQPLQRTRVSVNALVNDSSRLFEHICGPEVELQVETNATTDTVLADGTRIQQVLINLAVNANDAMPQGGTLSFHTDNVSVEEHPELRAGSYLRLRVRDTGHGIDHDTMPLIFDPFFTTRETGKGTGLGLSIVYGIVRQHDGVISVESEPGQGAEFSVLLPALQGEADSTVVAEQSSDFDGEETILVVEDDPSVRKGVRILLKSYGYRVLTADCPAEADNCLSQTDSVDLLLSDVVMPGESGPAFYQRLRQQVPGLAVLFMTGFAGQDGPADDLDPDWPVIQKPFEPTDLCRQVRAVLDVRLGG